MGIIGIRLSSKSARSFLYLVLTDINARPDILVYTITELGTNQKTLTLICNEHKKVLLSLQDFHSFEMELSEICEGSIEICFEILLLEKTLARTGNDNHSPGGKRHL